MLWGGLNLLAQAKDGKVSFIHSNNELRNYPIAYGMKVRNIAEAPGGVILVGTTKRTADILEQLRTPGRD